MSRKTPHKPRNWHALNAIQRKAGPMQSVKRGEQREIQRIEKELADAREEKDKPDE